MWPPPKPPPCPPPKPPPCPPPPRANASAVTPAVIAAAVAALTLITRTRDPLERSISTCKQISSSTSATSISVVGSHCKVLGISPGQMRHAEPSRSSTRWLLSCFLICIADLPCDRSEPWMSQGAQGCRPSAASTRAVTWPKDECADEFFRELRDRSVPPPEWSRIPPARGPDQ